MIICGAGMVSSLGPDALTGCAAARAGLNRISYLDNYQVWNPDENKLEPARGHKIPDIMEGFSGLGRLVRLSVAGINDLLRGSPIDHWDSTGLFIGLSDRSILTSKAEQAPDETSESIQAELLEFQKICEARLVDMIGRSSDGMILPSLAKLFWGSSTATLQAVIQAAEYLKSGQLRRCIVGGVDTLIDFECLDALNSLALLKTPTNPFGIIPGEGASFLLLEAQTSNLTQKGIKQTTLQSPVLKTEEFNRFSSDPPIGVALSTSIRQTLMGIDAHDKRVGLILGGLNGDQYHASDWGHAMVRLGTEYSIHEAEQWHAAQWFGEIGTASLGASVCLAFRAFERGYARTNSALVWISGADGSRGSCYLHHVVP